LAAGDSVQTIAYHYRIGLSTCHGIIKEVCDALWTTLSPVYLKPPSSEEDFLEVAKGFEKVWDLPHCIGAIDGRHMHIKAPPNSGTEFHNYKGTFSIVLLAVCDANYCFTLVDIGAEGSQSDGGVYRNSTLGKLIKNHEMPEPKPDKLPRSEHIFPYFYVGDEAFALTETFMIPFGKDYIKGSSKPAIEKKIFNYRLSRARRVIENAFGILASRWRIFRRPMECGPQAAVSIIKACVVLHNYVMKTKNTGVKNPPPGYYGDRYSKITDGLTSKALWRSETNVFHNTRIISNKNASLDAKNYRLLLTEYVNYGLALPYQRDYVLSGQRRVNEVLDNQEEK